MCLGVGRFWGASVPGKLGRFFGGLFVFLGGGWGVLSPGSLGYVLALVAGGACCGQVIQGVFAASALGDDVVHLCCWVPAVDTGLAISAHDLLA